MAWNAGNVGGAPGSMNWSLEIAKDDGDQTFGDMMYEDLSSYCISVSLFLVWKKLGRNSTRIGPFSTG